MQNNLPVFWKSIKDSTKKYVVFKGRSSRQEYIIFTIFINLVPFFIGFFEEILGLFPSTEYSIIGIFFSLAFFLPGFAVTIRRLHDVNRSGWWVLINLTIIGIIPFAYWVCIKKSDEGENRFGNNPTIGTEIFS